MAPPAIDGSGAPRAEDAVRPSSDQEALDLHASGRPGKLAVEPTKPLATARDLSLAYSPGVAAPCLAIRDDPAQAWRYTTKGNMVAVISNGTAVLGLGDIGALASKPVMEGKSVLFKRFADVDAFDLEVDTREVDAFVQAVTLLHPTFGGINLEDIKAPECFEIERRLKEALPIPVFHDDQHGTAIIAAAGLINAAHLTGRRLEDVKLVVNGAGAAAIACVELVKAMGVAADNVVLCDRSGVIYRGRGENMNAWKEKHAVPTNARTLEDAMEGADCFFGLSAKGAVSKKMVRSMAAQPIVFAMANPDPEITPEEVAEVRGDAIMATGRSDYPNQINNVLGFPYVFRGALDVQAREINDDMKIAAAQALAQLARDEVPEGVSAAYAGRQLSYGPGYVIPTPFDPRLIVALPVAVAEAAMRTGVAQRPIADFDVYRSELRRRLEPASLRVQAIIERVQERPKRVVFVEGEEEKMIRAALAWRNHKMGKPILIGREDKIRATLASLGRADLDDIEILSAAHKDAAANARYADYYYARMQRHGMLYRDCLRMVNTDRNVFAGCMVALGDADAMVTGLTRPYRSSLDDLEQLFDPAPGQTVFGLSVISERGKTIVIADSSVHEDPTPRQIADIAKQAARETRHMGLEPRVAFLSFSTFGDRQVPLSKKVRDAVALLDQEAVDFEYDGELSARVAIDDELLKLYPFCRLSGPANVLVMPSLHASHISAILLQQFAGCTVLGPVLHGLAKPAQILPMNAQVGDIVNMAAMAAFDAILAEGA